MDSYHWHTFVHDNHTNDNMILPNFKTFNDQMTHEEVIAIK